MLWMRVGAGSCCGLSYKIGTLRGLEVRKTDVGGVYTLGSRWTRSSQSIALGRGKDYALARSSEKLAWSPDSLSAPLSVWALTLVVYPGGQFIVFVSLFLSGISVRKTLRFTVTHVAFIRYKVINYDEIM